MQELWEERQFSKLQTHDDKVFKELFSRELEEKSERLLRLDLIHYFAETWQNRDNLAALCRSLDALSLEGEEEEQRFCKAVNTALSSNVPMFESVFVVEKTRKRLLDLMEKKGGAQKEASACFVKLVLFALKDSKVDNVVANFCKFLIIPLRHALQDHRKATSLSELQIVVNAAQIITGRCAAQSYNKDRQPDEVEMFAEEKLFDDLAFYVENKDISPPIMHAIEGLMVSPKAVEKIDHNGVLVQKLKNIRNTNKKAFKIVDTIELTAFKKTVTEKTKERGGDSSGLGNEMLGVIGAANGPKQFGFEFSNKSIETDFKNLAFKEGVIKPMAEKMAEEGEHINVDDIAKSVLKDFTKPKMACFYPGCEVDPSKVTKRCGRCKQAYYCGVDHQSKHWKEHKRECWDANN